ncbi:MAG: SIMPL domain-containing protein [Bacteroidaceae bacterium]|nr:SIMPL domain-containing protein [Bacteroidaceae bacterium]MDE7166562.1 SIMPL domain-containing protein [Bacteroidaceae bacterium]
MCKGNNLLIAALIVALGMCCMGISIRSGIVRFKTLDRKVTVKGLSEREVLANKVTWPLIYKELGNDPSAMYELIEQKNQKVVSFLKAEGLGNDEISVNPPTIRDRQADNYGNEIMNYRYKAECVIIVTSTDIDKVRRLMRRQSELMKQGIALVSEEYGDNSVRYEYTGLNDIKQEMVEEAMKNAKTTAEQFARDADARLDGVITAQQGQFSIDDRDRNTPYIKRIRVVNTVEYALK